MFKDNLNKIEDKFFIDYGANKYADGWAYKCRKCGAYAFYMGVTFHCQNDVEIPQKIRCSNFPHCDNRWVFKLTPNEEMRKDS